MCDEAFYLQKHLLLLLLSLLLFLESKNQQRTANCSADAYERRDKFENIYDRSENLLSLPPFLHFFSKFLLYKIISFFLLSF